MAESNQPLWVATMMHIQGAATDKPRRTLMSKNKKWTAGQAELRTAHTSDGDRWERGGHRRRGRGRGAHGHHGTHLTVPTDVHDDMTSATEDEGVSGDSGHEDDGGNLQAEPETAEERERFYQEVRLLLCVVLSVSHHSVSSSKNVRSNGSEPSRRARWMTLLYRSDSMKLSQWSAPVWICAQGSSATGENERTTWTGGKSYVYSRSCAVTSWSAEVWEVELGRPRCVSLHMTERCDLVYISHFRPCSQTGLSHIREGTDPLNTASPTMTRCAGSIRLDLRD